MVLNNGGGLLPAPTSGGTTMEQYAGIDVSLDSASVCIVDAQGKILKQAKVACEPEALIAWFAAHGTPMARIGLEAGPLSQWLFAGLKAAGLPVELLETRHVRAAFSGLTGGCGRLGSTRGQNRFRAGSAPGSPGAKSRRRDDGSGQAANRGAAFSTTARH